MAAAVATTALVVAAATEEVVVVVVAAALVAVAVAQATGTALSEWGLPTVRKWLLVLCVVLDCSD